jgi:hypothetical protein
MHYSSRILSRTRIRLDLFVASYSATGRKTYAEKQIEKAEVVRRWWTYEVDNHGNGVSTRIHLE